MDETTVVDSKVKAKKPGNYTQAHTARLAGDEAPACEILLLAMDFSKNSPAWNNPPEMDLPLEFEVKTEDGLVWATVGGKKLQGYKLISWLIFRSMARGVNLVKIGALVMAGVHNISLF